MKSAFLSVLLALLLVSPASAFIPWAPPKDMEAVFLGAGTCSDGRTVARVGYTKNPMEDKYDLVAYEVNGVTLLLMSGASSEGRFTAFTVFTPDGKSQKFGSLQELMEKYPSPCDLLSPAPEKPA